MNIARLLLACVVLPFFSAPTWAAGVTDCSEFMKFGIYDQHDTIDVQQRFYQFQQWIKTYEHKTYEEALTMQRAPTSEGDFRINSGVPSSSATQVAGQNP
jgi:hypothetical protein